jgi:hypothetical protein
MSKTFKDRPESKRDRSGPGRGRQRNISVRAVRRDPPDLRKLSRALIQLALAEAEAEAEAARDPQPETESESPAEQEPRD